MARVCFVCLGNICRSPTAEGIFRHLVTQAELAHKFSIDSAGTGAWHVGEPPDRRATATAQERGVRLEGQARAVTPEDFRRFDYIIAMDRSNFSQLSEMAPEGTHDKLHMLREFDPKTAAREDVPDPYYGGPDGFAEVFEICDAACRGLLTHLQTRHGY